MHGNHRIVRMLREIAIVPYGKVQRCQALFVTTNDDDGSGSNAPNFYVWHRPVLSTASEE